MHKIAKQYGLAPRDFSPATIEACQAYSWPGNLRELQIFVKRYLMSGDKGQVFEKSRPDLDEGARKGSRASPVAGSDSLKISCQDGEAGGRDKRDRRRPDEDWLESKSRRTVTRDQLSNLAI